MSYAADRSTQAVPVTMLPGSHPQYAKYAVGIGIWYWLSITILRLIMVPLAYMYSRGSGRNAHLVS